MGTILGKRLAGGAMRARRPLNSLFRTRLVSALATPHGVDHYLALADPAWSVRQVRARVIDVRRERGGAVSVTLLPNEIWRGFHPGQFVELSVRVSGVRSTRCFSLSSAPEDGPWIRVTIKLVPGGRVSAWAAQKARIGDVVELSQARGQFVFAEPLPPRILFLTGGSGITPALSMVRHLVARGYGGALAWLHYVPDEVIHDDELHELARTHGRLRLAIRRRRPCGGRPPSPRFSVRELESWLPEWRHYEAFACGPTPLLEAVGALWREEGLARRLAVERFSSPVAAVAPRGGGPHRVVFARSGREAQCSGERSLLEEAERAGLRPAYGCRMGICQSCRALKRAGAVQHALTGGLDAEPDHEIQLCIHRPCSDVTLDI